MKTIPFNRPYVSGKEFDYMRESIASGKISGDGQFTARCNGLIESELGVGKSLLTTSCTHALEMCAILLNISQGDEVILPSFTFVSTANAFVLRGARPVFADIRPDTLNIDESKISNLITSRTKAIVVVHYAGVACEMDQILSIAAEHDLFVVEDNAHGLFGRYKGQYLGSFGCMATQSFHETKNFSCGEGGALLLNDLSLVERAEIIREKGTNRSRFFRGQVDKYTWVDVGSSYLPSDMLAAFLLAQLESRDQIQGKRARAWQFYDKSLEEWANCFDVRRPIVPDYCDQAYHMYYLLLPGLDERRGLIDHLSTLGINAVFHYVPLHLSAMGVRSGEKSSVCPVTEDVSDRLIRLPFYNEITDEDLDRVVQAVQDFQL